MKKYYCKKCMKHVYECEHIPKLSVQFIDDLGVVSRLSPPEPPPKRTVPSGCLLVFALPILVFILTGVTWTFI